MSCEPSLPFFQNVPLRQVVPASTAPASATPAAAAGGGGSVQAALFFGVPAWTQAENAAISSSSGGTAGAGGICFACMSCSATAA
jgi:hypothetical protein